MDTHPTPFPGKTQTVKSKYNRKITDAPKIDMKEPPIQRQKRVFGTARNPNIPEKPTKQNPSKPPFVVSQKITKSETPVKEVPKKSPEKNRAKPKKKSVCFEETVAEIGEKNSEVKDNAGTPGKSPSLGKARGSITPYHTARRCSDCRFDKLETSSYWLAQIRLAESAGKHFVSAGFFQLAFQSKAEPLRNLRVELRGYLARHIHLSAEVEWKDVSRSYGLLKDESNLLVEVDSGAGKTGTSDGTVEIREEKLKEQAAEDSSKTKTN